MKCSFPYFHPFYRIYLPCGQCLICRQSRKKHWTSRIIYEASLYSDSTFLTLTYDEASVPASLCRKDLTDFLKRLRNYVPFRYYACGEYGSLSARPHFHLIIFGLRSDVVSEYASKAWKKGFIMSLPFFIESAAYVAGYVSKKLAVDYKKYSHLNPNFEPEFQTMSRRPGLSFGYVRYLYESLKQYADILDDVPPYVFINDKKLLIPRYFKTKLRKMLFTDEKIKYLSCKSVVEMQIRQLNDLGISDEHFATLSPYDARRVYDDKFFYQNDIINQKLTIYNQRS